MKIQECAFALVSCLSLPLLLLSCAGEVDTPRTGGAETNTPVPAPTAPIFADQDKLDLAQYKGRVVVLELGMVGCELTDNVYQALQAQHGDYAKQVTFIRVDYKQSIEKTGFYYKKYTRRFTVLGDPTGTIGDALPSQAMPTLYLYGKWGKLRYAGGYHAAGFKKMLAALQEETKPNKQNFYLKKKIDRGDKLRPFKLPDLAGKEISLATVVKKRGAFVLVFSGTGCPYSKRALEELDLLRMIHAEEGLTLLAVNIKEATAAVKKAFLPLDYEFPVLIDPEGKVAREYGVESVPTIFITGPDQKVVWQGLWNKPAIEQELAILFGTKKPEDRRTFNNAGTG